MVDVTSIRREVRYGMPAADQVIFNRHYVLGYSYYFRQAKWALEIVDPDKTDVKRIDSFRPDYRIPEMFRADLVDYQSSGYDRGHLIASANQIETAVQNSETFLLSNMSPQDPKFNRGIWRELEEAVREMDSNPKIYETYVICGPVFDFRNAVNTIGSLDDNGVSLPIPNSYFKSILTEDYRGNLKMWSFIIPNKEADKPIGKYAVPTVMVEQYAGIKLWSNLEGKNIDGEKKKVRAYWG
ncbi:MAG: DNA/RNA endonuclease G [Alphaproteobacteria bacterium CG11_big_fil_rev_8_21_14_0_20_39_49]|nr:MAG: DNA/RNA endonuclease G [Alphaproteobacteria bacterium CG11_big_fil_rev_8_21_14_0_20_39_49]